MVRRGRHRGRRTITRIHGRTHGLKVGELKPVDHLHRRHLPPKAWITPALVEEMCRLAGSLNRMVGVVIDRRGRVREVALGDAVGTDLPPIPEPPGTRARLTGLRFFRTAPAGRRLGERDLAVLRRHRLDALGLVTFDQPSGRRLVELAHLTPHDPSGSEWHVHEPLRPEQLAEDFLAHVEALEQEIGANAPGGFDTFAGERALLVGTVRDGNARNLEADLDELARLLETSGGRAVGRVVQRRPLRDARTLVRAGKLDEINRLALEMSADLAVFLEDLSPSQANNLVESTGLKIVDRTQLILDIFAQRATTAAGKIMVELARLRYLLPRLVGQGQALSRLGGGIGSNRGLGEKRLELDRRRIQESITRLEARLEKLKLSREVRRRRRRRARVPVLALVGYTNAGKTSWLNRLTGAGGLVENRLFSTLETTARRLRLPSHRYCVVTDTVGFIRDLPEDLKATFRATLEELNEATVLIHVADASRADVFDRVEAVETILAELGCDTLPRLLLHNKADRIDSAEFRPFLAGEEWTRLVTVRRAADVRDVRRTLDDLLDTVPDAPPRKVPRHLEADEAGEDADAAPPPAEALDYRDVLDTASPPPPRPRDDDRERPWGFF